MRSHVSAKLLLLLSLSQRVVSAPRQDAQQHVLAPPSSNDDLPGAPSSSANVYGEHAVDEAIWAALKAHPDPVDALVSLHPELAEKLAEPRLILVAGQLEPEWMTEGDKLRLRREKKKFRDITDHQDLYKDSVNSWAGKASKKALLCASPPPLSILSGGFTPSTKWMLNTVTIQSCRT